jgi:enoyl-CoA hydratase/carnithine racemase
MSDNGLSEQRAGAVAYLTLENAPFNPIGVAQVAGLKEAMARLAQDVDVRAIVIKGAGEQHFSVGANLKEADQIAEMGSHAFCAERQQLYQLIEDMPKPVIAAIRGYCLGGGMELALASHFRLADFSAQCALPEIDLGTAPLWGGAYRIVRTVGRARGLDMLISGRKVPAEEAREWGLLHRVFESSEFDAAVESFAADLATKAPLAVAAILKVVNAQQDMKPEQALAYELEEFDTLSGTKDNIEGIMAMFEKRPPVFTGE